MKTVIEQEGVADHLLARLEEREVALWCANPISEPWAIQLLALPWKLVIVEDLPQAAAQTLKSLPPPDDVLVRKRGYPYVIESDPTRLDLPERCLPIFPLTGRNSTTFENQLRRLVVLDQLRRSNVRELLIVSDHEVIPESLTELWQSGFRAAITVVNPRSDAGEILRRWIDSSSLAAATLVKAESATFASALATSYLNRFSAGREIIRVRDAKSRVFSVDITGADDPDRPVLEHFTLLYESDVTPLTAEELTEEEFQQFFADPTASWKPYAAGLPWKRDPKISQNLQALIKRLDAAGSDENFVAFIRSEPGAGGTTSARQLALDCARLGHPVLVAKPLPFNPDPLRVTNYLNSCAIRIQETIGHGAGKSYQPPWVIVFDSLHWQNRESELARFRQEFTKSGRVVCILTVCGPVLPVDFYNRTIFKELGQLGHVLSERDAQSLGSHLNKFLGAYGKKRSTTDWNRFYHEHTVRHTDGLAAFWITLSFWIRNLYNIDESVQEWIYRAFKQKATDPLVRDALLQIAALSTERVPMPESLLPSARGSWPAAHLLEDSRSELASLGLVRIAADGQKFWTLIHDLLGRWLLNALFYDFPTRTSLGLGAARDAEHLRFLLLRFISQRPEMAERSQRALAEEFATTFFKIDPDHGIGSFAGIWREVLGALEEMPRILQDTSRVFRHHVAISRRRIAKLDETLYAIKPEEKRTLLARAVDDIRAALMMERSVGDEPDLLLYNSLANAYFDLADVELALGAKRDRILELRSLATDATKKAFNENPNNPFTVETYVKNLIQDARATPENSIGRCVEALGVVFSALSSHDVAFRKSHLSALGDQALRVLLQTVPPIADAILEPRNATELLVSVWRILSGGSCAVFRDFDDLSGETRRSALAMLLHASGRGNLQVLRLRYDLTSIEAPSDYRTQLQILEELSGSAYQLTPQLKLEYAVLLFIVRRAQEGDKLFHSLRRLWRQTEQYVSVPRRLRWLRDLDTNQRTLGQAVVSSEQGGRSMARVPVLNNILVPFRSQEFGISDRPGTQFTCLITFGHNGPLLRPATSPE